MIARDPKPWFAIVITVFVWAGYLVAVRAAAGSNLKPVDIGLLRSLPAALVLLPFSIKRGLIPGNANNGDIFCIGFVGGTCFTFFLGFGARYAPVADSGVFAPSMLPVFVALLSLIFLQTHLTKDRLSGLALILFGAVAIGGWEAISHAISGSWRGHLFFLAASFSWAVYTVRFRASGLSALDGTIILVTWSAIIFIGVALSSGSNLHLVTKGELAIQLALGISAGLIANFTFLFAVARLGPAIPAASAALVPIIAALGGWVFLNEPVGPLKALGICIVALGVVAASGFFARRQGLN